MKVSCDFCGCWVSADNPTCPQCGGKLNLNTEKEIKVSGHEKRLSKEIPFDGQLDPLFNMDAWLLTYEFMFKLGESLARIVNKTDTPEIDAATRFRLLKFILLQDMVESDCASPILTSFYRDVCRDYDYEIRQYPGAKYVVDDMRADFDGCIRVTPVSLGKILAGDGSHWESRTGMSWKLIDYHIYHTVICAMECRVLMSSSMQDLFAEQYPTKFENTRVALYFRFASDRLFASNAVRDWRKSPKHFNDLLRDPKVIRKMVKELDYGVITSDELDKMYKFLESGHYSEQERLRVPNIIKAIDAFTDGEIEDAFGVDGDSYAEACNALAEVTGGILPWRGTDYE